MRMGSAGMMRRIAKVLVTRSRSITQKKLRGCRRSASYYLLRRGRSA